MVVLSMSARMCVCERVLTKKETVGCVVITQIYPSVGHPTLLNHHKSVNYGSIFILSELNERSGICSEYVQFAF